MLCLQLVDFRLSWQFGFPLTFICWECLPFDVMFPEMGNAFEHGAVIKTVSTSITCQAPFCGIKGLCIGANIVCCNTLAVVDVSSKRSDTRQVIESFEAFQWICWVEFDHIDFGWFWVRFVWNHFWVACCGRWSGLVCRVAIR